MAIPRDCVYRAYDPAAKSRWNDLRERFMLQRVLQSKGTAEDLVVVCGFTICKQLRNSLALRQPQSK